MTAGAPPRPIRIVSATSPARVPLEPYRLMFPIGIAAGLLGSGLWPIAALSGGYPAVAHRTLMILGFEMSFVLGFLLTAMPAFTRGERCRPWELSTALIAQLVVVAGAVFSAPAVVETAALGAVLLVAVALGRRVVRSRALPPEEFVFVAFALVAGVVGAVWRLVLALGAAGSPPARFTDRLTSLGMVLPLVLGLGSLLVPTFTGMRDPLAIPFVAAPHERRGRRGLYATLVATLALAFAAELAGHPTLGAWLRAAVGLIMVTLVWKLYRGPGLAGAPARALWLSGWMVALGLVLAAAFPKHATAMLHVVFIGGFGLLTIGIATRVVVSHGRHPLDLERAALAPGVVAAFGLALAARLAAELDPARAAGWLAVSGIAWWLAWIGWCWRAIPALLRHGAR
jgi:uncharacterized protein involved in response to NO